MILLTFSKVEPGFGFHPLGFGKMGSDSQTNQIREKREIEEGLRIQVY
jgi:hypothetical protein